MFRIEKEQWTAPVGLRRPFPFQIVNRHFVLDLTGAVHLVGRVAFSDKGLIHITPIHATQPDNSLLKQTITIPAAMEAPTLSFVYQIRSGAPPDDLRLIVEVTDGSSVTAVFTTVEAMADWRHGWANLSQWKGKTVTISFRVPTAAGQPLSQVFLDEVSLGSAYPIYGSAAARQLPGLVNL
jgi:hypothetical protein